MNIYYNQPILNAIARDAVFQRSEASYSLLGVGVLLLDAGVRGNQIANQVRIYSLDRSLRCGADSSLALVCGLR
jgi:hypothetical protein